MRGRSGLPKFGRVAILAIAIHGVGAGATPGGDSRICDRVLVAPAAALDHRPLPAYVKARRINQDAEVLGIFSEIGAGQRIAERFFNAGDASRTIVKAVSNYGKDSSSAAYGECARFVCEPRLRSQLEVEWNEIQRVSVPARPGPARYFVLADTVVTRPGDGQAWIGIRFEPKVGEVAREWRLHVRMYQSKVQQQQQTLGKLGVNLVYAAMKSALGRDGIENLDAPMRATELRALLDGIAPDELEIDVIREGRAEFGATSASPGLWAQALIDSRNTSAVLVDAEGEIVAPQDYLYRQRAWATPVQSLEAGRGWPKVDATLWITVGGAPSVAMRQAAGNVPIATLWVSQSTGESAEQVVRRLGAHWMPSDVSLLK